MREHPLDSALILGESQQCSPGGASEATSHTVVPLNLDFAAEKGGPGRLGRVETGLLSRTLRHRNQRSRPQHTGETRCAPLLKSKSKRKRCTEHPIVL
jgi:hypothetical protein